MRHVSRSLPRVASARRVVEAKESRNSLDAADLRDWHHCWGSRSERWPRSSFGEGQVTNIMMHGHTYCSIHQITLSLDWAGQLPDA